ncbi:MAG: hypothetical protein L6R35_003900 [Caloplaca aegaea]|nr:MAG: hypothetical protein L6R35_003900 [Caloplaca aegaea]
MSRRGYASSDLYDQRERERDYLPPRDRGGRTVEYDEVDIRERRRTSAREPDFLREDYGRSAAGPLVIRDDKRERESEYRSRPRDRPREVDEREVIVAKGPRSERPSDRDINFEREELVYRTREPERPRTREINIERDDIVYQPRPREPEPQQIRRMREDWEYRRPREPEIERETINIREREQERPRERDYKDEEIIIRRGSGSRERERPRARPSTDQEIVIRRSSRSRERERPRQSDFREEDIIIRRDERERERPRERDRGYEKDEIIIRRDERERDRPRTRASSFDRETIKLRVDDREPRRTQSRGDFRQEDITIRREERERPSRDFREEDLVIRRRDASRETRRTMRSRSRSRDREDITIRHDERGGRHRDEIIIRRDEKSSSPSPEPVYVPPAPLPEPEPIIAPPIHREIITHHRHIDHGFETRAPVPATAPAPAPPRPRSPSPQKSTYDEIEIRRHSSRNGRHYDEDLIITERDGRDRDSGARRRRGPVEEDHTPRRRRSPSLHDTRPRYTTRDELDIAEEADYYNSRAAERSYLGEGYHGANKDWAIVDVPPGTKRVEMEGIGGAKAEITWQRYNGVRRSKFVAEDDTAVEYRGGGELMAPREREEMHQGRRFVSEKDPKEKMWTEITKDLVTEEAIKSMGYDFEETEFFYYIMSYLRYEEVLRLVEVSEDLKRDRRERIREIEWEQQRQPARPRLALTAGGGGGGRPWDEERIVEREIVYEGAPPPSRRYR